MAKYTYVIIESCYHTSYLITSLSDFLRQDNRSSLAAVHSATRAPHSVLYKPVNTVVPLKSHMFFPASIVDNVSFRLIIRQKAALDKKLLDQVHEKFYLKSHFNEADFLELEKVYGNLSDAERALIAMRGVPRFHVLSFPAAHLEENLNSLELEKHLRAVSVGNQLSAAIFLDCILKPWWLEVFENRIVNAHSAVLPHARGMYAIEQTAAKGDVNNFITAAGASIHYIDHGVDTGPLIAGIRLNDIWQYESIAQIKAASYLLAFDLLNTYVRNLNSFQRNDTIPYVGAIGPVYRAKEYTYEVRQHAKENYTNMRSEALYLSALKICL